MTGVASADLERLAIVLLLLAIVPLLIMGLWKSRPVILPQVPPAVAPLSRPLDDDVRELRHWRGNAEQVQRSLVERLERHEAQLSAVRADLGMIKSGLDRNEHMLNLLTEHALAREQSRPTGGD